MCEHLPRLVGTLRAYVCMYVVGVCVLQKNLVRFFAVLFDSAVLVLLSSFVIDSASQQLIVQWKTKETDFAFYFFSTRSIVT